MWTERSRSLSFSSLKITIKLNNYLVTYVEIWINKFFLSNTSFEVQQKHLNNKIQKKTSETLKIKSEPIGKVRESSEDEEEITKPKPIRKNSEHNK